jgi:hypothetical protein
MSCALIALHIQYSLFSSPQGLSTHCVGSGTELFIPAFRSRSEQGNVGRKKFGGRHLQFSYFDIELSFLPIPTSQKMAERIHKEKKRKREKDGSSNPSKRVAIEEDKQIKISLVESGKWAPVIGMSSPVRRGTQTPV